MIAWRAFFQQALADRQGAVAIETAIVAPVLLLLSLGVYQVSTVVARQSELESAAAEGAAIALASIPDTSAKRTTLQQVLMASTGLGSSHVTVTEAYRCSSNSAYVLASSSCTSGVVSKFVKIVLTDSYSPAWTQLGIGNSISFSVTRYVMYQQQDVT